MAKQKQLSPKYQVWIDTRKKHKLSHAHIQMARELGMNPKKLETKEKSQSVVPADSPGGTAFSN